MSAAAATTQPCGSCVVPEDVLHIMEEASQRNWQRSEESASKGDFDRALLWLSSTERLSGLEEFWYDIPVRDRARLLAISVSSGDLLINNREFLTEALDECHDRGELVVDCQKARERFAGLPDRVEVFRGTVNAETWPDIGVSWTLDKKVAEWFASGYRCTNRSSPPCILRAIVPKVAIYGLLLERTEQEILIVPSSFRWNRPTRRRWVRP